MGFAPKTTKRHEARSKKAARNNIKAAGINMFSHVFRKELVDPY
jgi:hypothetical protein